MDRTVRGGGGKSHILAGCLCAGDATDFKGRMRPRMEPMNFPRRKTCMTIVDRILL